MIETWKDSWFTEGTRVFYLVPSQMIDQILPLQIEPKPAKVARVFVGRIEVFTPATIDAVAKAIDTKDDETLQRYGRFLGPIVERRPALKASAAALLDSAYTQYVNSQTACRK
jgi:hypothetical protein